MKKRIEFFHEIKGVAELFPIIEAKDYKPNWTKKAKEDYLQNKNANLHIHRCPGIFDLFNCGYIIRSWHDINMVIPKETVEEGKFQATTNPQLFPPDGVIPILKGQEEGSDPFMRFVPRPKGTLNNFTNLNTLWHIVAPRGLKFLFLPLPYPDSFEFYNAPGILDPGIVPNINLQLSWNITGSYFIQAGTPLGQLIPLTEKKYDFICRDMNENDGNWLLKFDLFRKHSFKRGLAVRKKIREIYEKHFKLK